MASTDTEIDWAAFVPTEEAAELAVTVRDHFASLFSADDVRKMVDGQQPPQLWPILLEHGYTAIGLPEELDGIGSMIELVVFLEEAGKSLIPAPLLASAAAVQTLLLAGLAPVSDPATLSVGTVTDRDVSVFDATASRHIIVVSATEAGTVIDRYDLPERSESVRVRAIDPSRASASYSLSKTTPAESRTLPEGLDSVLAAARTCVAADLVGCARRALDGAVAHAISREQFGRPIGSFQSVKHLLANAFVSVERARSLVAGAAVEVANNPLSAASARAAMLAKAAAADAATGTAALYTQLLGAIGLTFEADSSLIVRRAAVTAPFLGGAAELYARVAADSTIEPKGRS